MSTADIDAITDCPGRPKTNDTEKPIIFPFKRNSLMNIIEVSYCNRSWLRLCRKNICSWSSDTNGDKSLLVWIELMMMDAMKYRRVRMSDVYTDYSHLRVPLNLHQHCEPLVTHRQKKLWSMWCSGITSPSWSRWWSRSCPLQWSSLIPVSDGSFGSCTSVTLLLPFSWSSCSPCSSSFQPISIISSRSPLCISTSCSPSLSVALLRHQLLSHISGLQPDRTTLHRVHSRQSGKNPLDEGCHLCGLAHDAALLVISCQHDYVLLLFPPTCGQLQLESNRVRTLTSVVLEGHLFLTVRSLRQHLPPLSIVGETSPCPTCQHDSSASESTMMSPTQRLAQPSSLFTEFTNCTRSLALLPSKPHAALAASSLFSTCLTFSSSSSASSTLNTLNLFFATLVWPMWVQEVFELPGWLHQSWCSIEDWTFSRRTRWWNSDHARWTLAGSGHACSWPTRPRNTHAPTPSTVGQTSDPSVDQAPQLDVPLHEALGVAVEDLQVPFPVETVALLASSPRPFSAKTWTCWVGVSSALNKTATFVVLARHVSSVTYSTPLPCETLFRGWW